MGRVDEKYISLEGVENSRHNPHHLKLQHRQPNSPHNPHHLEVHHGKDNVQATLIVRAIPWMKPLSFLPQLLSQPVYLLRQLSFLQAQPTLLPCVSLCRPLPVPLRPPPFLHCSKLRLHSTCIRMQHGRVHRPRTNGHRRSDCLHRYM